MTLSPFQFGGDDRESRLNALYGSNDLEKLFPNKRPTAIVPWEGARRRKRQSPYDQGLVNAAVHTPTEEGLEGVDPRLLHSTQPQLQRAGVEYYLGRQYGETGRTFADQHQAGNRFPVVYSREGEEVLLSGHHRAAAALLRGEPLRARRIVGPWGPDHPHP